MAREIADILESIDARLARVEKALRREAADLTWCSIQDYAKAKGYSCTQVRRMLKAGRIPFEQLAGKHGRIRIPRSALQSPEPH